MGALDNDEYNRAGQAHHTRQEKCVGHDRQIC